MGKGLPPFPYAALFGCIRFRSRRFVEDHGIFDVHRHPCLEVRTCGLDDVVVQDERVFLFTGPEATITHGDVIDQDRTDGLHVDDLFVVDGVLAIDRDALDSDLLAQELIRATQGAVFDWNRGGVRAAQRGAQDGGDAVARFRLDVGVRDFTEGFFQRDLIGQRQLMTDLDRAGAAERRQPRLHRHATSTTAPATTTTTTTAAIALCQSALRERDLRIASLERELALMESEFHRELDKLSSAESETAAYWQGKYAALEKQVGVLEMLQMEGVTVVASDGGRGLDLERERERERERQEEIRELRIAWERARDVVEQREGEIGELKAQVRGLKEWVSVSTRADGLAQTSDEVFGEGMARLGNGLQNWVLVNFRRARVGECAFRFVLFGWGYLGGQVDTDYRGRPRPRRRGHGRRAGPPGAHVRRAGRGLQNPFASVARVAGARGTRV